jgi:hypothetical protein
MTSLWLQIKHEIAEQLKSSRAFVALAGTESDGRVTIKRFPELTEGTEEYARLAGMKFTEDDEIICTQIGGKPVPLGRLSRSGMSDYGISFRVAPQTRVGAYYSTHNVAGGGISSGGYNVNTLYAFPFYAGPGEFTADRISLDNATAVADGAVRLGIYDMHDTSFEPSALLLDAGTVSLVSTGIKEITINHTLTAKPPHYMVWLAMNGTATPSYTLETCFPILPIIGSSSSGTPNVAWVKSSVTYGALPNPFTAGGATDFSLVARLMLRRA